MTLRIEARGLVKQWKDTVAVDCVSFDATAGTLTVLLGPSGCGKSTILRLIAGLEDTTSGTIIIGGRDVTALDPARRGVSMVFQSYALFPHLTVRENIEFGLKVRKTDTATRTARVDNAAEMVDLTNVLHRKPSQLSGGQRQRVALARSIVSEQPVCLMDEPLSNLDAKLRAVMRTEIRALQQNLGLTMIYVTHDQVEAMTMADQIILLNAGRIEQCGTPRDLYERPGSVFAAQFIGAPPMNILGWHAIEQPWFSSGGLRSNELASIGVRPEHIVFGDRGIEATVTGIDYHGVDTIVRLRHHGGDVMVRAIGDQTPELGAVVRFGWEPEHTHVFDADGIRQNGP